MTGHKAHRLAVAGQGLALILFASLYAHDGSPYWAALAGWCAFWGAQSSHWLATHRPAKPGSTSIRA